MENTEKEDKEYEESVELEHTAAAESVDNSVSVNESASTTISSPGRKQFLMAVNKSLENIDPVAFLKPVQQCIYCKGDDRQSSFSVYGNDVSVYPSDHNEARSTASNKIRISLVCKFDWEQRYYYGNLLASNKTYIAYVVGVKKNPVGQVRVINHYTSSRVLLKGFEGKVTDIEFGGPDENHLACMDMKGNLRIFHIFEEDGILKHSLMIEVTRNVPETEFSLVSWAPILVDEDGDDEEQELMVAVSYKGNAAVLSLNTIIKSLGSHCSFDDIEDGIKRIESGHAKPITNMVISPNLEVLATSSLDGCVKFWDTNFENPGEPSCLHDWQPHDGDPVTSLFFCDNHFARDETSSSWRFLITGSNYNRELKVWCAVSWKCLQIIRFAADPNTSSIDVRNPLPCLKPVLDKSAKFFILTDIQRNVLYILQLHQNSQEGTAHFTSFTECILTQPMLNFSLYDSKAVKRAINARDKMESDSDNGNSSNDDDENGRDVKENGTDELENDEDFSEGTSPRSLYCVSLKMFAIYTRALQKLHIKYTPSCSVPPATPTVAATISSEDPMSVRDAMSDITEGQSSMASDLEDGDSFATANFKISKQTFDKAAEIAESSISSITTVTGIPSPLRAQDARAAVEDTEDGSGNVTITESREAESDQDFLSVTEKSHDSVSERSHFVNDRFHDSFAEKSHEVPQKSDDSSEKSHDSAINQLQDAMSNVSLDSTVERSYDSPRSASNNVPREEARPIPAGGMDSKPQPGSVTILKRAAPDKATQPDKADGKDANIGSGVDESITRPKSRAKRPTETKVSPPKPKEAKKPDKHVKEILDKKEKKERCYSPCYDDIADAGKVSNPAFVATGDLLGLDHAGNAARGQKEMKAKSENESMECLMAIVQQQQKCIMQLTNTVNELSGRVNKQTQTLESLSQKQTEERDQMKVVLQSLQKNSSSNLSKTVKEITKNSQRLDNFTASIHSELQHTQEKQLQMLMQAVNNTITAKMDKLVKTEMKSSVLPEFNPDDMYESITKQACHDAVFRLLALLLLIQKLVTLTMDQITNLVAEKLAAVEKTLREDVAHLVRSKSVAESIGFTASTILEGTLPNAYREAFQNVLIPSYEESCKEMFNQINKSFEKGTKFYFDKLDSHFENGKQRQLEMRDPVLKSLQGLVQTLEDTADRLTGSEGNLVALLSREIKEAMSRTKADLLHNIPKNIQSSLKEDMTSMVNDMKDELNAALRSVMSIQSSQVPVESSYFDTDPYETIDKFLEDQDYQNAFKTALTISDLSVVVYVCQKVDHEDLFTKHGSSLDQPIILSLIQQLSADLSNDTEIKGNYLLAATCELDHKNQITAEHMPNLLGHLIEQADKTIQMMKLNDSDNPNIKQLKSLSQIANKLLML